MLAVPGRHCSMVPHPSAARPTPAPKASRWTTACRLSQASLRAGEVEDGELNRARGGAGGYREGGGGGGVRDPFRKGQRRRRREAAAAAAATGPALWRRYGEPSPRARALECHTRGRPSAYGGSARRWRSLAPPLISASSSLGPLRLPLGRWPRGHRPPER